jgi:hypothetical protein
MAGVRNRSIFGNENLMRNDNSTKFKLAQMAVITGFIPNYCFSIGKFNSASYIFANLSAFLLKCFLFQRYTYQFQVWLNELNTTSLLII